LQGGDYTMTTTRAKAKASATTERAHNKQKLQVFEYDEDPLLGNQPEDASLSLSTTSTSCCREYILTQQEPAVSASSPTASTGVAVVVSRPVPTGSARHNSSWLQVQAIRAPIKVLQDLFLPIGFPATVRPRYLEYQLYDSLQGLCSYLRGVVCNAHVLKAAGVGNAEATAMSAALTWALKDGLAMMGALVFSYAASPLFDSHVKEFRLFADVINDVGLTLDMMAPWFAVTGTSSSSGSMSQLLLVTSAATLCKTLCGMAAGATKSSITVHFAIQGNMADLNAKESTQETLVSLTGMMLGVSLARQLTKLEEQEAAQGSFDSSETATSTALLLQWGIFVVLTVVHVWANWKGVKLLHLETLNRERAHVVLRNLVTALQVHSNTRETSTSSATHNSKALDTKQCQAEVQSALSNLPRPVDINESLLASTRNMLFPGRLVLGARLVAVLTSRQDGTSTNNTSSSNSMQAVVDEFRSERYVLAIAPSGRILVSLLTGATAKDELKAFVHAVLTVQCLDSYTSSKKRQMLQDGAACQILVQETHEQIKSLFADSSSGSGDHGGTTTTDQKNVSLVSELTAKGWHVEDRVYLGFPRRRSRWNVVKTD
jgi:hypothetical protein